MSMIYFTRTALMTHRSSIDLLQLNAPFTQLYLLTARDFVREANERGFRLSVEQLEELHRVGVLKPFYRVELETTSGRPGEPVVGPLPIAVGRYTVLSEVLAAASDGRLADPALTDFTPWPTDLRRPLWPSVAAGYVYSPHQLLGLEQARRIVKQLRPRKASSSFWHLPAKVEPDEETLAAFDAWRSLAIVLSALDTPLWPQIRLQVRNDFQLWQAMRVAFDVRKIMDWLRVTETQVRDQADDLLSMVRHNDVLGDFYDVVRRADPATWDSLRGPARTQMDSRLAAELLLLLADELRSRRPPQPKMPIAAQRLSERPASLDSVLTALGLSPFPAVVLGLEGATEMLLMPRVMELLGIPMDASLIVLVDYHGNNNRDLTLLAHFSARPTLGEDYGKHVALARPVTRFLVMSDAENDYATADGRDKQRRKLVKAITEGVPADLLADLTSTETGLVEIVVWGKYPFEFAHFTDRELAIALIELSPKVYEGGLEALIPAVARQRLSAKPDVCRAWRQSGVSKPKLADALWPLLARKIKRAIREGRPGPPIMRAAMRAHQLALRDARGTIVLRRNVLHGRNFSDGA